MDGVDRDAYREWWETGGRTDLTVCPCGGPAEDIMDRGGIRVVMPAGPGFCPRHRYDLHPDPAHRLTRERFARRIMADPSILGRPLTDGEARRARLVADGFLKGGPN